MTYLSRFYFKFKYGSNFIVNPQILDSKMRVHCSMLQIRGFPFAVQLRQLVSTSIEEIPMFLQNKCQMTAS